MTMSEQVVADVKGALRNLAHLGAKKYGGSGFSEALSKIEDQVVLKLNSGDRAAELKVSDLDKTARTELGRLKASTERTEAMLVKQLFDTMQQSHGKSELEGPMSDMARDMMHQSMSEDLAKNGSLGISKTLFDQMSEVILRQRLAAKLAAEKTK